MGIVVSILLSVLACEVYAWLPLAADALLAWAVSKLDEESRERYREEWQAHLSDRPNIVRVIDAVGLHWAARGINTSIRVARHDELGEKLEVAILAVERNMDKLAALRCQIEESRRTLNLQAVRDSLPANREPACRGVSEALGALTRYADSVIRAHRRLLAISDEKIAIFEASLHVGSHHLAIAKGLHSQIEPRSLSYSKRAAIQNAIEETLAVVVTDFKGIGGKTTPLDQQRANIMAAVDDGFGALKTVADDLATVRAKSAGPDAPVQARAGEVVTDGNHGSRREISRGSCG